MWLLNCIKYLYTRINLFESGSDDEDTIRKERYSSWIYIILFIGILTILISYTSFTEYTTSVTVEEPSKDAFESLMLKYSDTLQCPCTAAFGDYLAFVELKPIYHQVKYYFTVRRILNHINCLMNKAVFCRSLIYASMKSKTNYLSRSRSSVLQLTTQILINSASRQILHIR